MRRVSVISVGSLKEAYLKAACAEYIKRLSPHCGLSVVEIAERRLGGSPSPGEIARALEAEGRAVISRVPAGARVFPLCIEGEQVDSPGFARLLCDGDACFVIGSSHGLADEVKRLGRPLSFSRMTYPHQLMRVILLEQIYRGFMINAGGPYHK